MLNSLTGKINVWVGEILSVNIWFNKLACLLNKPHKFEGNFECQNRVISNLHENTNMTL